jgi:hypothetical protein
VIAILGVATTLVASTLVLLKGLKEPQTSQTRAQGLRRLLREIEEFKEDLENPMEDGWRDRIRGFRMELERILPHGSFTQPTGAISQPDDSGTGEGSLRPLDSRRALLDPHTTSTSPH